MSSKINEDVEYPDLYLRMFAWFIDITPILIIGWFLSEVILNALAIIDPRIIWLLRNLTDFLLGFHYFWLMETLTGGKTLGKYVVKIRTVDEKSLEPTTTARYAINNLTKATIILILDVIFGLFLRQDAEKGQIRHTQQISHTIVIRDQ